MRVDVVIPAIDEEESIAMVLDELSDARVRRVIVADNGSTDATASVARAHGALVVHERQRGYGRACLTGIAALTADPPDVVAFLDGDYSDYPEDLTALLDHLRDQDLEMVIGSRNLGLAEEGALLPQAIFGNWLATTLIRELYGLSFTDLGPFRVIRWDALTRLEMEDPNFGWTVEMQVKAAKVGLRCGEIPVRYRARVGQSKVTGTVSGSVRAGYKILWTIFRELRL